MFILWLFSIDWEWFVVPGWQHIFLSHWPKQSSSSFLWIHCFLFGSLWVQCPPVSVLLLSAFVQFYPSPAASQFDFRELASPASWPSLDCCSTITIISKPGWGQAFSLPYCLLSGKWWGWRDLAPTEALIPSFLNRSVLRELMDLTSRAVAPSRQPHGWLGWSGKLLVYRNLSRSKGTEASRVLT